MHIDKLVIASLFLELKVLPKYNQRFVSLQKSACIGVYLIGAIEIKPSLLPSKLSGVIGSTLGWEDRSFTVIPARLH